MLRRQRMRRLGRGRRVVPTAAALIAVALAVGCTSEDRNETGTGLVDVRFDALAETLVADVVTDFGEVAVAEAAIPFAERQLLYVGREGGIRSQLLARYDFAHFAFLADSLGAAVTPENIKNAQLLLYAPNYFRTLRQPDSTVVTKTYVVRELAEPLGDTSRFPGPPPALAAAALVSQSSAPLTPLFLDLPEAVIADWAADPAGFLGLAVGEDEATSEPGLIGFAARKFPYAASQLCANPSGCDLVGTVLGPVIRVEFFEPSDTFINLAPVEDVSTLTGLEPVPASAAEGLLLQTHVRVYPRLWFDLSQLPPNVLINYAGLVLTPDTTLSFGPSLELVVGEVDSAAVAGDAIELTDLDDRVRIVTGRFGVEPEGGGAPLVFDVTSTLQRVVNGATAAPVQFMLLAGEDFTGFDSGITDPEYFLSRFFFQGTAAADPAARPRLRIVYTAVDQIRDGGVR